MKEIALIACVSKDLGLGYDNELLWRIPEDMKFFRTTTRGATVVMGSKTFASIGKPLPGRKNVVLSRRNLDTDVEVVHNEAELSKRLAAESGQIFIIGGASLYAMFINQADRLFLTEVDSTKPADTFFPTFDRKLYERKVLTKGQENSINYEIVEYTRKERHV